MNSLTIFAPDAGWRCAGPLYLSLSTTPDRAREFSAQTGEHAVSISRKTNLDRATMMRCLRLLIAADVPAARDATVRWWTI